MRLHAVRVKRNKFDIEQHKNLLKDAEQTLTVNTLKDKKGH